MHKELFYSERNINSHVLNSKSYDLHLRALKGIMYNSPIIKNGERRQHPNEEKLIFQQRLHVSRANNWMNKEKGLAIEKENKRILNTFRDIECRERYSMSKQYEQQQEYRNQQLNTFCHLLK